MILERLIVSLGANITDFQKGMGEADNAITKAAKKIQSVGKGLTLGVTVPLAAVGTAALAAAKSVDDAMDTISIKTGATGETLKGLGADFTTVFESVPASADQVAQAIGELNQRTGQAGPGLQALAAQILNLSRITETDLSANIAASTRLFGDWSVATDKQAGAMDLMFRASQQTGISVTRLMEGLVQFGGPLRQLGFGFEESAALMAKWEKEGVNTELVLGSLRIGLAKFAKEGKDAPIAIRETITEIAAMKSASQATAEAIKIFGARAGPDMAAAIREGRFSVEDLLKTISGGQDTIQDAAKRTADWGEQWQLAKNKLVSALQPIGVQLFDALGKVTPLLISFVEKIGKLVEWFANLSPTTQKVILVFAGLLAAVGPVVTVVGSLITAVSGVGVVFGAVFVGAAAPVAIAIGIFAALVTAIVLVVKNFDTIIDVLKKVGSAVGNYFLGELKKAIQDVENFAGAIVKPFKWMYDKIVGHSYVPDLIQGIDDEFAKLDRIMVRPTTIGVGKVIGEFDRFRTQVTTMEVVLQRHASLTQKIIDVRADLALAKNATEAAKYTAQIKALEAESARYLATVNKLAVDALPKVDIALAGVGREFETKTIPLITSATGKTEELGTEMLGVADKGGTMVDALGEHFGRFKGIADTFNSIGLNLDDVFGINVNSIISKAGNLMSGLKTVFETDWGTIAKNFINFFNSVISTIGKFLDKVDDFLSQSASINNQFSMPGGGAGNVGGNIGAVDFGKWGVNLTSTNKLITQTNTLLIGQTTILASIESKIAAALTTNAPVVMQATTVPQAMTAAGSGPVVFQITGPININTSGDGVESYEKLIAEMQRRALNGGQYTREIVNALPI